jgi:AcrR family transcriptional regulator
MSEQPATMKRTERSRANILRTAFELLTESAYAEVTIERIAARARVGKPTIYRRWPSKGAVVLDAFIEHMEPPLFQETGDPREDVRAWMHSIADFLADPGKGPLTAELVGAAQHDPELAAAWHERLFLPIRSVTVARLQSAQAAGLRPDADAEVLADLLAGPLWFKLLCAGEPPTREWVDKLLATALPT